MAETAATGSQRHRGRSQGHYRSGRTRAAMAYAAMEAAHGEYMYLLDRAVRPPGREKRVRAAAVVAARERAERAMYAWQEVG